MVLCDRAETEAEKMGLMEQDIRNNHATRQPRQEPVVPRVDDWS